MQKHLLPVALILVFVLFVKSGESLRCYECRSDEDKGCDESMNKSLSKECPPKEGYSKSYCRKINQKLKFKDEDSWTKIRECAYETGQNPCYHFKWVELAYQEICECASDNCNSGHIITCNILTVAIIFSVLILNI